MRYDQQPLIRVSATGTTVTSSGTSARTAIPVNGSGGATKKIRLSAHAAVYVKALPGDAGAATANDMRLAAGESVYLDVEGLTYIAALEDTTSAKFTITPLD
jgi:hypothetical protein